MNLRDALFNWLQIKIVSDARPEDGAARNSLEFFEKILTEDHHLTRVEMSLLNDHTYRIQYTVNGVQEEQLAEREMAEQLLEDIQSNPQYGRPETSRRCDSP
ncbi:Uncharacterised protein [Chlamydia abortus]|jgi:hypothetical protein|uniref:Uncharacterized protein n=1 Tax=Paenibacillus residui TaxID=629724 RepID=A0ABW3DC60_9BACL|nr:Uncharacterised protein [Chlamydia abortus]